MEVLKGFSVVVIWLVNSLLRGGGENSWIGKVKGCRLGVIKVNVFFVIK